MGGQVSKYAVEIQGRYKLPEWVAFHLLHQFARVIGYWVPNLLLYIIHRNGWFMRYKIQGERMPAPKLVRESVLHNIKVDVLMYYVVSYVAYTLFTKGAASSTKATEDKVDGDADGAGAGVGGKEGEAQKGWANLRVFGKLPSWQAQVVKVMLAYLGYDAMFYWSHRLLHQKQFYLPVHKLHHTFHTPVGPSASYEHPVESFAQLLNWYVPLGLVGHFSGDLHVSTVFYYHLFRWFETVDAHCGFAFPFSPFHFIPGFGGAVAHDGHHRHFFGNYGATLFWDWICGTALED